MECAICGDSDVKEEFRIREMMIGTRDEFSYWQCGSCDSLNISEPPGDLDPYYPKNYYSLSDSPLNRFKNRVSGVARRLRDTYEVFGTGSMGRLVHLIAPGWGGILASLASSGITRDW